MHRAVSTGQATAKAADRLSPSGDHRMDWDPHRLRVEPFILKARPGGEIQAEFVLENPSLEGESLVVHLEGRGLVADQLIPVSARARETSRTSFRMQALRPLKGRAVLSLGATRRDGRGEMGADVFCILEGSEPTRESK